MPTPFLPAVGLLVRLAVLAAAGPPRCDTPEFRQFDFWVGEWDVTSGGQEAGTNSVTLEEDGCLVHEHWTGAGGGTGQSLNYYDRADRRWHQVWVSNSGGTLTLSGGLAAGALVLEGERPDTAGRPVRQRLTFRPNADGSVRQLWESSSDGGRHWSVVFDGRYRRRPR